MDDIEALMSRIRKSVDRELESCAKDLLSKALQKVPVGKGEVRKRTGETVQEGGTLYDSGFEEARHESPDVRVHVVVFDTRRVDEGSERQNFNYAIIRHEMPVKEADGEWKYLENPYKENKDVYEKRLQTAIGSNLGKVELEGGFVATNKKGITSSRKFDD